MVTGGGLDFSFVVVEEVLILSLSFFSSFSLLFLVSAVSSF